MCALLKQLHSSLHTLLPTERVRTPACLQNWSGLGPYRTRMLLTSHQELKKDGRVPRNRPLAFGGYEHTKALWQLAQDANTPLGKGLNKIFSEHRVADAALWSHNDPVLVIQAAIQLGFLVRAYYGMCPLSAATTIPDCVLTALSAATTIPDCVLTACR